ncbi:hypothetical protein [Kibdelosporangium aridum]|nr:hypothetical protein [Kibdelosporangium aridum]
MDSLRLEIANDAVVNFLAETFPVVVDGEVVHDLAAQPVDL